MRNEDVISKFVAGEDVNKAYKNVRAKGGVLYSYLMPIAKRKNGKVYIVDACSQLGGKFVSVTTSQHVMMVWRCTPACMREVVTPDELKEVMV